MRFNPKARLDASQVEDRTGGGGRRGGGSGLPIGRLPVGGGLGGLVVVLIVYFVLSQLSDGGGSGSEDGSTGGATAQCTSGAQANDSRACRLVAVTNSIQNFWGSDFEKETGRAYQPIRTVSFRQSVSTGGCGEASADAGPFYCPNDQRVYLDLTFFDNLLDQLGGQDTAFTEAYVVAHEYGHHIQNLMGLMGKVRTQQGANSDSVKLETMADCLAGVWAKSATTTVDENGEPLISDLTQSDIREGIAAAKVVGDDSIQQRTSGRVNPEDWTHGSSAQRVASFDIGLEQGTIAACNYFDPDNTSYPAS